MAQGAANQVTQQVGSAAQNASQQVTNASRGLLGGFR
jgi:hypothetical protein